MKRSRGGAILVSTFLVGSTVFLTVQNYQLRTRLTEDREVIAALQAGGLHKGVDAPTLKQPVTLVRLDYAHSDGLVSRHGSATVSVDSKCPKCDENDGKGPNDLLNSASGTSLLELKQRYIGGPDSELILFIFFAPTDCPACLREAKLWQGLFQDREALQLSVVGIVDQCSQKEAEVLAEQLGTTFPVLFDAQSTLRSSFRISRTPEKILIDKGGHVLLTDGGNKTEETQIAFDQEVRRKVQEIQSLVIR